VPWVVATAVVKGKVTVDDFTDEAIKRQEILKIAQKVSGRLAPEMDRHGVGPGGVIIKMQGGEEYREEVEHCLGSAERPMGLNDITKKFRECATFSRKALPDVTVDKVIEMAGRLEKLDDATQIIQML
jgi:2-methylcitrate dehydratase PrpD